MDTSSLAIAESGGFWTGEPDVDTSEGKDTCLMEMRGLLALLRFYSPEPEAMWQDSNPFDVAIYGL